MKAADLDILLQEGEGVTLEYKESPAGPALRTSWSTSKRPNDPAPSCFFAMPLLPTCSTASPSSKKPEPGSIVCVRMRASRTVRRRSSRKTAFSPRSSVRIRRCGRRRAPRRDQVPPKHTPAIGTKLALSRHQVEILRKCHDDRLLVDIMVITGRSDRTKFKHQVLNPLIEAGFIDMTVPDKPRSSKQRYRTTPAGRAFIENAEKETQP